MNNFRKVIFWMHLICGVVAGLIILIMSVTGVALTYEKQMARWADGFEAKPPSAGAAPLQSSELLQRAYEESGRHPTSLQLYVDGTREAKVSFGRQSFAVDPYTGERFGEGATGVRGFFRSMIVWHRWLGADGDGRAVGKAITGVCNLAFVFILISGPYLWWPKKWTWKQLRPIVWFRGGLSPKARDFNWHNVLGLWLAIPLFIVSATGAFFSYSWPTDLLYRATGEQRAQSGGRGGGSDQAKTEPAPVDFSSLDSLVENAKAVESEWTSLTLRLPETRQTPVSVSLQRGHGFRPGLRSTLVLDQSTGEIVRHETHADNKKAQNLRVWVRFLHTGEALGLFGQTLAGLASLAACVLVYTGLMLSWRRFVAWRARQA